MFVGTGNSDFGCKNLVAFVCFQMSLLVEFLVGMVGVRFVYCFVHENNWVDYNIGLVVVAAVVVGIDVYLVADYVVCFVERYY